MPKRERTCELEDNYGLQFKIRVTPKEVDRGVSAQENMQTVYERTLRLLRMGANVRKENNFPHQNTDLEKDVVYSICRQDDKHTMQLQIGSNGKLCLSDSHLDRKLVQELFVHACQNCSSHHVPSFNEFASTRCNFCERAVCSQNVLACHICTENYCSKCSTTLFGEDNVTCLSCATSHCLK